MSAPTENKNSKQTYIVGVDVGTTAVKASLINEAGHVVETYSEGYPKSFPKPGWVEQDADVWVEHIFAALRLFSNHIDLLRVEAICLVSQVNTHVFVGDDHRPLLPAIVWSDTRTKNIAASLDSKFSVEKKNEVWGFEFIVDSSYSLSRAAWVKQNAPDVWNKTKWVMSPKDYCNLALCGVAASDSFSSVGLTGADGTYVQGLDSLLEGFSDRLPPLNDMFQPIGKTNLVEFPSLKADVITGTMDAFGNFIGSGIVESGLGALITGTSSVLGIMSDEVLPVKGVITFPPFLSHLLHAGPTQSGSDAFVWFAKLAGKDLQEFLEDIETRELKATAPIFLPHLQGERAPLWDPNARGTFIGLTHEHDLLDMGLAVMEGVAFSERHVFDVCCETAGLKPTSIRLSGGSSRNDYWAQLRANCLGVPLQRLAVRDSGILGAALIAMVGKGVYADTQSAAKTVISFTQTFHPDPKMESLVEERFNLYKSSYLRLKPIFDSMVQS